jgi:hypothetical protein
MSGRESTRRGFLGAGIATGIGAAIASPAPASTTGTRTASAGGNRALVAQHPARSSTMSRDDAENAMWWMPTP